MNGKSIYLIFVLVLLTASTPSAGQTASSNFGYIPGGIFDLDTYRPILTSNHYNSLFLRDSTYKYEVFRADTVGSPEEWLLKDRSIHHYDNIGKEAVLVRSTFNGENWEPYEQLEFSYRVGDELEKTITKVWSERLQDWVNQEQLTYNYTYSGQELEVLTEEWSGDRWKTTELSEKFYGDDDQLERHTSSLWSNNELEWVPEQQMLYTYGEMNELPETEKLQFWNDSLDTWVNETERTFVYDEDDNVVEAIESAWSIEYEDFIPIILTEWGYNSEGLQEGVFSKPFDVINSVISESIADMPVLGSTATYNDEGNLDQ
jgi:hypothetical protein